MPSTQQEASKAQLPLKKRLLAYFQANPGVSIASADIQRMVMENTNYTPSNAARRLRELVEEGELSVKIEKRHAFYTYTPHHVTQEQHIEIVDGVAVRTYKNKLI